MEKEIYRYKGENYVRGGDYRLPKMGEIYDTSDGTIRRASSDHKASRGWILIPAEEQVPCTYIFRGEVYVESGEYRLPRTGEIHVDYPGGPIYVAGYNYRNQKQYILILKEESSMDTYMWGGRAYVRTGEYRFPLRTEMYLTEYPNGEVLQAHADHTMEEAWILTLKGQCTRAKAKSDFASTCLDMFAEEMKVKSQTKEKYTILEPISPNTVWAVGDRSCEAFCKEFTRFLQFVLDKKDDFCDELNLEDINEIHEARRGSWIRFLINNKFIKKVGERTYYAGQWFYNGKARFVLAYKNRYAYLVNLTSGQQWRASYPVSDVHKITQNEFDIIGESQSTMRFRPISRASGKA